MPEQLKKSEVTSQTDPSVSKQYDSETPAEKKFEDFYSLVDGLGVCMMGTRRDEIGVSIMMMLIRIVVLHADHVDLTASLEGHGDIETKRS